MKIRTENWRGEKVTLTLEEAKDIVGEGGPWTPVED